MREVMIGFFDALGSSARMESYPLTPTVKILEILADLTREERSCLIIDAMVDAQELDDGTIRSGAALGILDVQNDSFSDSALIWAIFDRARFWTFCEIISEFFCIALKEGIPLRGGISVGQAHMDRSKSIYVGRPMAEVVKVEKSQQWIGVSFGPSFLQEPQIHLFRKEHVLEFSQHRKEGKTGDVSTLVLDWPRKWRKLYSESPIKKLQSLNRDSKYSKYYELAIKFCEKSERVERIGY